MKSPLLILHLEDDPNDAALVQAALEAGDFPFSITRAQNREEFLAALERGGIDLILADYRLPTFDSMAALEIARANWPDIPFIHVSGTLGEQQAIDSLKSGATDYILKTRLPRLAPAVRRAMQAVEQRAERARLETQLIEAQKMQVIGQLASGVAHDFNNMIFIIMSYCDLIIDGLGPESPLLDYSHEIRQASERAASLTRQLLIFSRRQAVNPVVLDLNEILKDLNKMLRRLIDENIEMSLVPAAQMGHIKADSGYVGQVLMNLVVNARDAMPNGGKLAVATSNVTLDPIYASSHPGVLPGDYVVLSVSDTGAGMTSEVKARLFEPFFTTKPRGKGTGLGLATCHTIIQQSGGHISVQSEPGHGTTFRVHFPLVRAPLDLAPAPLQAKSDRRGSETLLIVEDEPSVRLLARRVLEARGYQVLMASNGQDALQVVRHHAGPPIRLVVTDVIMPLMGGKEMAEWLRTALPQVPILFTSGYTDDAVLQPPEPAQGIAFLPKPYTPSTLINKVREMLDAI